jgi:hypothetical protein
MNRSRLRAPEANGAILAQPSLDEVGHVLAQNRSLLEGWQYDFQGRPAARIRAMCRTAVLDAARKYIGTDQTPSVSPDERAVSSTAAHLAPGNRTSGPQSVSRDPQPLLVTGHQPELFHPGVWVKNFASYELARKHRGVSLHLIVDNDTVKRTTVRLPAGTLAHPSVVHVPFDRWRGEIPYEEYEIADRPLFASFGERVASILESLGIRPLAADFWPLACTACGQASRLGECLARARRWQENAWGCRNFELPVSRLCQTEGFYWFAAHVLAQLGRFRTAYNQALAEYRQRNRIRSRNHPVPSLGQDGEWLEAPFWVWSDRVPRRRQLFLRQQGHAMLLTDREEWTQELPLSPDREACCAVEVLADLARRGIKIRTRALTTTIFSRLCLGDLFIHGLGGARYDELTDQIIQRFFDVSPPQFLILTGTLRLPFTPRPGTTRQLHELQRLERDLTYSPDRFASDDAVRSSDALTLVETKRQLVAAVPRSAAARRRRFEEIRRINAELRPYTQAARAETSQRIDAVQSDMAANAILLSRDWPFLAYPAENLRSFFQSVR